MMSREEFDVLNDEYQRLFGLNLVCIDPAGHILYGDPKCGDGICLAGCHEERKRVVLEALRWGEPSVNTCPRGYALWGIPLTQNSLVTGGLVAEGVSLDKEGPGQKLTSEQIRRACNVLQQLTESRNLTNAALLKLNRIDLGRETERAQAIHLLKSGPYDSIREVFLREEPALLSAVKRGERKEARKILNRVLVAVYQFGGLRLDLLKSAVLELVVMLCRAAVEAGGDPTELLGGNYRSLSALANIQDEEGLCAWLTKMLERQMDAIRDNRKFPNTVLLGKALAYMREHITEDVTREQVARKTGLSSSHFSRLIKEKLRRTFTDLLRQYRVDHAKELLLRTAKSLAEISFESGFSDQSYFTKVFQKHTDLTPSEYRKNHEGWRQAGG
jgi:AraC-like DNA-binding protein